MPPKPRRNTFVCPHENCDATFNRQDRLKSHLFVHNNERPFVCSFEDCSKSYTRNSHLKRHEATHETIFRCKIEGCETILKSKETYRKHMDVVHKKRKTYTCTICSASFNKHSWLQKHMYRHTGVRPYLCPYENCDRRFLVPNKMKKHMLIHEGYTCEKTDCNRKFATWSLYVKHFKIYHTVVHKCDVCDKIFSTLTNLRCHKELHNDEREVFVCPKPYCTRFYFAKRNLNYHIRHYHDKRPFVCSNEKCQRAFTTEALLTSHLRVHDPNKRTKKRKKKKPSYAAFLAGCVEKKSQVAKELDEDEIKNNVEHSNAESGNESSTKELDEDRSTDEIESEEEFSNLNLGSDEDNINITELDEDRSANEIESEEEYSNSSIEFDNESFSTKELCQDSYKNMNSDKIVINVKLVSSNSEFEHVHACNNAVLIP